MNKSELVEECISWLKKDIELTKENQNEKFERQKNHEKNEKYKNDLAIKWGMAGLALSASYIYAYSYKSGLMNILGLIPAAYAFFKTESPL